MTADQIRKKFLDFFASKGHKIVASDSLVPKEDPTVLFTTAGMQQFKRQFLGQVEDYRRAASSQKCLRTDDLDHVGKTPFHHTFFEMLGNFSFGDYFKKEAIEWGWEFLTKELKIPKEKLWASIYEEDREAEEIWLKTIKIPADRLVRLGDKSNFWPSEAKTKGPNGPCGPCSEIFYDYGVNPGCPRADQCNPDCDCGRFSEVWNLVFTQFNRKEDGELEPLPNKNIDTGMGLERLAAVVQGKESNFETDLFAPILHEIDRELKKQHVGLYPEAKRIMADHIRAIVFGINDGVIPSNKERGFVIKRLITDITDLILRQQGEPFGNQLAKTVIQAMREPYPELVKKEKDITLYIKKTEDDYKKIFETKLPDFQIICEKNSADAAKLGAEMFKYRDTYGLTLSTLLKTMDKVGVNTDIKKEARQIFQRSMEQQQQRSRAYSKMTGDVFADAELNLDLPKTDFVGNDQSTCEGTILKLFKENQETGQVHQGDAIKVVLDRTPFYAESGGQIGDTGALSAKGSIIRIVDTQRIADIFIHIGHVERGTFNVNDTVEASIDTERRLSIMRHHTATHLLQAALRKVLGPHVQQQGSLVAEDRFRFDFTHPKGISSKELDAIEQEVNAYVLNCDPVEKNSMSLPEAKKTGALAFFAEKYGETVRVVSIDGYSKEFCGGTHLDSTGQVGLFKIISESAIAQGIRRIEAVTGKNALAYIKEKEGELEKVSQILKAPSGEIASRVEIQVKKVKELEKELETFRFEALKNSVDDILKKSKQIKDTKIVMETFEGIDINLLRKLCDALKQKSTSAVMALGSHINDNAFILIAVTDDLIKKGIKANEIIGEVASLAGGSGGGRPQLAQAGSKDPSRLKEAIARTETIVKEKI